MAFSCCPHQGRAVPSCPQFLPPSAALANYSHPLLAFPWACGQYINVALVLPVKFITKEVSHFLCHLQSIFFLVTKNMKIDVLQGPLYAIGSQQILNDCSLCWALVSTFSSSTIDILYLLWQLYTQGAFKSCTEPG